MEKLLVKDGHGKVEIPENMKQRVQDAFHRLNSDQVDRFYRARKVFFITKTESLEFEDAHV